jgi:hypothetical protein
MYSNFALSTSNPEYPKTTPDSTCSLPFFLPAPSAYETANIHLLLFLFYQPALRAVTFWQAIPEIFKDWQGSQ